MACDQKLTTTSCAFTTEAEIAIMNAAAVAFKFIRFLCNGNAPRKLDYLSCEIGSQAPLIVMQAPEG